MKKILTILICVFFIVGCGSKDEKSIVYKTGDEIVLKSYDKKELVLIRTDGGFKLKNDENKIIIFDLFGTFCPPCKEEAPYLFALQNELKDDVVIIGLAYFEKKDNKKLEEFAKKYNAKYFLTNDSNGDGIIESILDDISYEDEVLLPFKVVLKDGKYETLSDMLGKKTTNKFYLGKIPTLTIKKDIQNILSKKQ